MVIAKFAGSKVAKLPGGGGGDDRYARAVLTNRHTYFAPSKHILVTFAHNSQTVHYLVTVSVQLAS